MKKVIIVLSVLLTQTLLCSEKSDEVQEKVIAISTRMRDGQRVHRIVTEDANGRRKILFKEYTPEIEERKDCQEPLPSITTQNIDSTEKTNSMREPLLTENKKSFIIRFFGWFKSKPK